jgi:hypothetical protein
VRRQIVLLQLSRTVKLLLLLLLLLLSAHVRQVPLLVARLSVCVNAFSRTAL